ncbi:MULTISPECIES: hypothetical protein [Paraburkholderia]|uniref:Uncharacterized protein n=1 Tax=Paraburkholderia madseniana TaxID=2599607 RepID=A0AAP5BK42_9BURK|nr:MULTISPECIES: hypothetical protein [Paraburkholderia]MCX4150037.1 hypothetical protein [Paraburkholderia madseniana]MCX4175672.1 hypothetical protein [Paraburkholderia madseniana]MDN7152973.1 hypothetical protein [Paraburkholderia sp. WS6]MDQ6411855.1 hypothetical protein [Paraburkholderia madseniana]MDQ6463667.1 hypothetical protein [Paraburkholderia madseniana]
MTITAFGPVETGLHVSSFSLAIPGTPASLSFRDKDLGPAPAVLRPLRDGQMVSSSELYTLLPGLAGVDWKPVNATNMDGLRRDWIAYLDDVRVNLTVNGPTDQAAVDAALEAAADALTASLQLARDAMTGYWLVTAGDQAFTAFVRPDNSWWVAEALPATAAHRVSRVKAFQVDADPHAALAAWAATQGQPVTITPR